MCAQVRQDDMFLPPPGEALVDKPLGLPSHETQVALRADVYKELINKLAWALGSTYKVNYSNGRLPARLYVNRLVSRIVADHGFPRSTSK